MNEGVKGVSDVTSVLTQSSWGHSGRNETGRWFLVPGCVWSRRTVRTIGDDGPKDPSSAEVSLVPPGQERDSDTDGPP